MVGFINDRKPIHLCEVNHFYCKHPGAIAFSRELQRRRPGDLFAYQPYSDWDLAAKLPQVLDRFRQAGFSSLISPTPSQDHVDMARAWVTAHASEISNFSVERPNNELFFKGIPLGYLLTELLPQYFDCFTLSREQVASGALHALSRIAFWTDFYDRFDVLSLVFTHPVYDFGFPVFIARQRGIPAYSVNENHIYRFDYNPASLLEDYASNSSRIVFNSLSSDMRENLRSEATRQLDRRLFNNLPTGFLVNDQRSIRDSTVALDALRPLFSDTQKPKVVFMTHALSDAPYSSASIHPDFSTPLQTLHSLFVLTRDIDIHLFVKGHPQPFPRDQVELTNVVGMYPHVILLPSELSLLQLKDLGADLLITGWGTCAVEGAYLGIPVIAYTRFSSATEFGLLKVVATPDRLSEFLQDRASWALCGNKGLAIDAYAATEVMRSIDWCGIDFERLESELGKSGGYQSSFYEYWDKYNTIEREITIRLRIQRYLDSKSQWLTLLHM